MGEPYNMKQDKSQQKQNNDIWNRKFDYDEQIFIKEAADEKYLLEDDEEIAMLLNDNSSAL